MTEQVGWRGFLKSLKTEAPNYAILLPQLPRLLHNYLSKDTTNSNEELLHKLLKQQKRYNTLLFLISLLLLGLLAWQILFYF